MQESVHAGCKFLSLPEDLFVVIGTHLAMFDGTFRRRCDVAADAARLALVGNAECTVLARVAWMAVDPGCKKDIDVLDAAVTAGPPRAPDPLLAGLCPTSSIRDLRAATGRRSGTKEQLWRTVLRREQTDHVAYKRAVDTYQITVAQRAKARHCWVRSHIRKQIRMESRCTMDAHEIKRWYDFLPRNVSTLTPLSVRRWDTDRTPKKPSYLVSDVLRACCIAHECETIEQAQAAICKKRADLSHRKKETRRVFARLPPPLRECGRISFIDSIRQYTDTGSDEALEDLITYVDNVDRRFAELTRIVPIEIANNACVRMCTRFRSFVLHAVGSADQVAKRWKEIAFVERYTAVRWRWSVWDLMEDRGPEVRSAIFDWIKQELLDDSHAESPRIPAEEDIPVRLRSFIADARTWLTYAPHTACIQAVEISAVLGGPLTTLGRSFPAYLAEYTVSETARRELVVRGVKYIEDTFGALHAQAAREVLDATTIETLFGQSRKTFARAVFRASNVPSVRVLRHLEHHATELVDAAVASERAFRDAWRALDDQARALRDASSKKRWTSLVLSRDFMAAMTQPTEVCEIGTCGRRFSTTRSLADHRARKHFM